MSSGETVYSNYYQEESEIVGNTLIYDKPSDKKGSLKTCEDERKWQKQGDGIGWAQTARLNLTILREIPVGRLKCVFLE